MQSNNIGVEMIKCKPCTGDYREKLNRIRSKKESDKLSEKDLVLMGIITFGGVAFWVVCWFLIFGGV